MMNAHRRASLICLFNTLSFFEGTRSAPCPAAGLGRCPLGRRGHGGQSRQKEAAGLGHSVSADTAHSRWAIRGRFH